MKINEDLRIQKTRKNLRDAILELIQETSFEKITVIDICKKAMVNRMTFYKYYEDKYHLLNDAIEDFKYAIIDKLPKQIDVSIDGSMNYLYLLLDTIIDEVEKKDYLIKAISNQNNLSIYELALDIIHEFALDLLKSINKIRPFKYPVQLLSQFIEGGFIKMIYYWVNNQKTYPKAKLKESLKELISALYSNNLLFK